MKTIFSTLSLDRARVRWEDALTELTPVEKRGALFVKREDYFAPLGYGGINGAKVRQIVWLVKRYLASCPRLPGLLLAGSVKSPQLGRVAAVGKHFALPVTLVIGSPLASAYKNNENVRIAANLGACFEKAPAPYNPSLQATAKKLHEGRLQGHYLVEYGLSVEGPPERIEAFYAFCSEQVRNVPAEVETLLLPAGSCNTTVSVLYGIARHRPRGLRRVVLFGIGPTRIDWFEERLRVLERVCGAPLASLFKRNYPHHPHLAKRFGDAPAPYELLYYDLHSTKFASYQDEMPGALHGIALHPTYEGKMLAYMRQHPSLFGRYLEDGKSLFWIVGSAPSWAPMEPHVGRSDAL